MRYIIPLFSILFFCVTLSAEKADQVIVYKSKRQLDLLKGDKVLRTYDIALGGNPRGHKQYEGDKRTPEGKYTIDYRNPQSMYHKSLHISYPNKQDKARAKSKGQDPGGEIFIHGLERKFAHIGKKHAKSDWTLGCIAVTNKEIEEIWKLVKNGTKIIIHP